MIRQLAEKTHKAYQTFLKTGTSEKKNAILRSIAKGIEAARKDIKHANQNDLNIGRDKHLTEAFLDRLALNDARIDGMIQSCMELIDLPDPVGEIYESSKRPEGFTVSKMRVPIGVIGIIYEARPNVTIEAGTV
jgi:glutamate-5-semialdehyde dehydrogenase